MAQWRQTVNQCGNGGRFRLGSVFKTLPGRLSSGLQIGQ